MVQLQCLTPNTTVRYVFSFINTSQAGPVVVELPEVIANRPYLIDSNYTDFFGINCTSAINSIFVKNSVTSASQL
jgi:hypothetical protein